MTNIREVIEMYLEEIEDKVKIGNQVVDLT